MGPVGSTGLAMRVLYLLALGSEGFVYAPVLASDRTEPRRIASPGRSAPAAGIPLHHRERHRVLTPTVASGVARAVFTTKEGIVGRYQQTLNGSYSAVSKTIVSSTYYQLSNLFPGFLRNLQVLHTFAPLQFQNVAKCWPFVFQISF